MDRATAAAVQTTRVAAAASAAATAASRPSGDPPMMNADGNVFYDARARLPMQKIIAVAPISTSRPSPRPAVSWRKRLAAAAVGGLLLAGSVPGVGRPPRGMNTLRGFDTTFDAGLQGAASRIDGPEWKRYSNMRRHDWREWTAPNIRGNTGHWRTVDVLKPAKLARRQQLAPMLNFDENDHPVVAMNGANDGRLKAAFEADAVGMRSVNMLRREYESILGDVDYCKSATALLSGDKYTMKFLGEHLENAWFGYGEFAFLLDVNVALRQGKVQSIHTHNAVTGSSQALSHACLSDGRAGRALGYIYLEGRKDQVKKNMAARYRTLMDTLARAPTQFPEIQVDISNELVIGVLLKLPWQKEKASALWNRVVEEARAGQRLADAYQQPNKLNRVYVQDRRTGQIVRVRSEADLLSHM